MGDKKFTLLELHFDGPLRIGPSFGADPEPDVASTDAESSGETSRMDASATNGGSSAGGDEPAADEGGGGAPVKGAILGVVAIVALAVAARVLLGGDDAAEPELVDLEDVPADDDADDDDANTGNEDGV